MTKVFRSNGKLLLSGEYAVLDGAIALVLPCRLGQVLKTETIEEKVIHWKSYGPSEELWYEDSFFLKGGRIKSQGRPEDQISRRLSGILQMATELNPKVLAENRGFSVKTILEFPRDWGLGSSSTLINNVASWFEIDPYTLLENTFGGSGFDIAAAMNDSPVTYARTPQGKSILRTKFDPVFKNQLFFVYLNKKQNSRKSVEYYRELSKKNFSTDIEKISSITHQMITCSSLKEFRLLMEIHETLISGLISTPKIKSSLFNDYPGSIKSLGAWGGDFILATGEETEKEYFRKKGFNTIIDYRDMIL